MRRRHFLPPARLARWRRSRACVSAQHAAAKTLRVCFQIPETGFDPAQTQDYYSNTIISHIFDAPLRYDFLARPVRLVPNTAAALPEVSDDFRTFTVRLTPGIFFQDDPAFKGQRRELIAADYVYSIKRVFDPRWKSQVLFILEPARIIGLDQVRQRALKDKQPFDYRRDIEGLQRTRSLHVSGAARAAESALRQYARAGESARRSRARSGRDVRRSDHGASGRHRAVPTRAVDAHVAHRARAQSDLPRRDLRLSMRPQTRRILRATSNDCAAGAFRWSIGSK